MDSTSRVLSGFQAARSGFWRVLRAPVLLAGLWLLGVAAAAPATWWIVGTLERSFGKSRIHESMTTGFDHDWFEEFSGRSEGLDRAFDPTLTGMGAFYDNLERWLLGDLIPANAALLATLLIFSAAWLFFHGGVLDRYAHPGGPAGPNRFLRFSALYFFRLVRLAALSAVFYWLVYRLLAAMLERIEDATREATTESTVAIYSLMAWGLTALLLSLIHLCFGFAKAATVVEQRRSVLVAAARGISFVILRPARSLALYAIVLLASALVLGAFALVAPGPGQSTQRTVIAAFVISQLFLLIKLVLRLTLTAGQVALFQSALPPQEPESTPAAEPAPEPAPPNDRVPADALATD